MKILATMLILTPACFIQIPLLTRQLFSGLHFIPNEENPGAPLIMHCCCHMLYIANLVDLCMEVVVIQA